MNSSCVSLMRDLVCSGRLGDDLQSVDGEKGKNPRGQPRIPIPEEELLKYTDCTLEEAAKKLKVSMSTLKRCIKKLPSKTWSGLRQSILFSQCVHDGNGSMQVEEIVLGAHGNGRIQVEETMLWITEGEKHNPICL